MSIVKDLFDFIIQHKEIIKFVLSILVILLVFHVCSDSWNNMWHDFGKNLYRLFNK